MSVRRRPDVRAGEPGTPGPVNNAGTQFINLTPHSMVLQGRFGRVMLPAATRPARVESTPSGEVNGVRIYTRTEVVGLPEPTANTVLITSRMVKDAVPDRVDVLVPHGLIKDASGIILECKGLAS